MSEAHGLDKLDTYGFQTQSLPKLAWLRQYVVLAEARSFAEASERVGVSPASLAANLSHLERLLGAKLLEAGPAPVSLTQAGEVFLHAIYKLLDDLAGLRLPQPATDLRPRLNIGWSNIWGTRLLPRMLAGLEADSAQILPGIFGFANPEIEPMLLSGELDFGLATAYLNEQALLACLTQTLPLALELGDEVPFVIVGAPALATQDWRELRFGRVVSGLSPQLPKDWDDPRYPRRFVAEVASYRQLLGLCEQGVCAAWVPRLIAEQELAQGRLCIAAVPPQALSVRPALLWSASAPHALLPKLRARFRQLALMEPEHA